MTTATTALSTPGQIAANLPGILGFYPHDSLVIVTFTATDSSERFDLGPVLRMDLDDLSVLPDIGESIADIDPALVLGFVVTTRPDEQIIEIIDDLITAAEAGRLPIDVAWVTPEILTGEPVTIGFGSSDFLMSGVPKEWCNDVVAPVVAARAMEPLLAQGELPDLTREEAQAHVAHGTPHHTAADCAQLSSFAEQRARELSPAVYPALAADVRLLIDEARDLPLDELLADEEVLLTMATLLGCLDLRDLIIEDVLRTPATGAQLMLAVARTCTGFIRHNALCLYALCMVELKLPMRSMHALQTVMGEDPTHMLTRLLIAPAQCGEFNFMVSSVREGSRIVRARHGVDGESGVA
ncbi:DUF4192 domain-containing protein [Corynebacterium sp.]|uniref:DUF4192 domain-containing protein n=1 Tax=Corynebacterium sp. TaxID=1720 RepID=UPI0026DEF129|nr:DUF4192 domain-containing protein [Corynebacterium sp.]MDO5511972.1 DUF4192 domain-containing protein [Corynebacterium sp.]